MYPIRSNIQVVCQAAFAGKPAPTGKQKKTASSEAVFLLRIAAQVRIPRPLTSNRAQPIYNTTVATIIKVIATLILISDTPRMP